jgi:hypothetical protein
MIGYLIELLTKKGFDTFKNFLVNNQQIHANSFWEFEHIQESFSYEADFSFATKIISKEQFYEYRN